ncbi:LysR substrate-binding domain-containing protein [Vibrio profundum]|uniref:LysR substrate-binding domain-containing protein n=1 Tax=Vibrio profundum TaxID=2910247 RepID=UPI003D140165
MKKKNLPLQGLLYFYKAASLGSFKSAAKELFVSPAAVSQQIRKLEETLDTDLFTRGHRSIQMTTLGEELFKEVKQGFSHLQAGVDALNDDQEPYKLKISAQSSFAHSWLIPRLQGFRDLFPEISILIEPTNRLTLPNDTGIDLCVRFGLGQYPGMHSEWLMTDSVYPVCNPHYQQQYDVYHLNDLHKWQLIEDANTDVSWSCWLKQIGREAMVPSLMFDGSPDGSQYVLESALAMQGIALVKHSLAHRYVNNGTLVRIGEQALKPECSYFLCLPEKHLKRHKVNLFITWLKEQVDIFTS